MLLPLLYVIHFWYFDGMTVTFLVCFFVVQWTSSLQHLLREISIAHLWHLLEGCFEEKNRAHVRNITLLSLTCTSYYKLLQNKHFKLPTVPYIIFMKKVNHSSITPRWKLENPNNVSAVVAWHLNIFRYQNKVLSIDALDIYPGERALPFRVMEMIDYSGVTINRILD